MLVAAQGLVFDLPFTLADVALVCMVAEQQLLIFVEYLKAERSLVDTDPELLGKYFVTCVLLVYDEISNVLKIFVHNCK